MVPIIIQLLLRDFNKIFPVQEIALPLKSQVVLEQIVDYLDGIRTCLHKKCVRIFEHNFVADKAKIRRRATARQGLLTQYAAKFAEKTCAYAYEDRF